MRRVAQDQTLHGTGAGQTALDPDLMTGFGLSERQAQCAALLTAGVHPADLPVELGIAPSTAEKHLAALRDRLDQPDTTALCAFLARRRTPEQEIAFRCWQPVLPPDAASEDTADFARRLQSGTNLLAQLSYLREHLSGLGVLHIYYAYVPLSVQGFLKQDIWDAFLAPDDLQEGFARTGGLAAQPMALQLFNAPGDIATADYRNDPSGFAAACRAHGAKGAMAFGFPSGGGFVGFAVTLATPFDEATRTANTQRIRAAGMLMHGAALTGGTLAALPDLSIRERDALSALALGLDTQAAAKKLKVSVRAFGQLTARARAKLRAPTTAAAIYTATALNALVFL